MEGDPMDHLITHLRVVGALVIREMEARFGSKPGGYVWALLDPAAHVAMMTVIFGAVGRAPALGTSFPLYFATGYIAFLTYMGMSSYVVGAVKSNKSLLSYPVVAPIDTVVARFILQLITSTAVAVVVIGIAIWESRQAPRINYGIVVSAIGGGCLLGLGMGLVNITLFSRFPLYEKVFSIINRPLYLISGVFFLPEDMPHPFKDVILMNPIAHLIMWYRSGFYSEYRPDALDKMYLLSWGMILLIVGLILMTVSAGHLRKDMG